MNALTKNPKLLQFVNVTSFILVLSVNYLSNALPLNGRTAGEISDLAVVGYVRTRHRQDRAEPQIRLG